MTAISLADIRKQAKDTFEQRGFDSKHHEAWKYTPLGFLANSSAITSSSEPEITANHIDQEGINYYSLAQYLAKDAANLGHIQHLYSHTQHSYDAPTALNLAMAEHIKVLVIDTNTHLDHPINLAYLASQQAYSQLLVIIGDHSHATLVETFEGQDTQYHNHLSIMSLGNNSHLHHYRLQLQGNECSHIYQQYVIQEEASTIDHFSLNIGSKLARHSIYSHITKPHVTCNLNGITLGRNDQHSDTYIPSHHQVGHSTSNQHFRQLLTDNAKGIFYSSATVDKDCPKTAVHQLSKSVLLSDKAQAYARPELDILTDDVICSHGATIGQLDDQALFYLQSRGIDPNTALNLLTHAFVDALVDHIPHPHIKQIIQSHIDCWSNA